MPEPLWIYLMALLYFTNLTSCSAIANAFDSVSHQNMAEDHTCKGVGECHPYREFEGMQPSR